MLEFRKKTVEDVSVATRDVIEKQKEQVESEYDVNLKIEELAKTLQRGTDHTAQMLNPALSGLSDRWKNWVISVRI